MVVHPTSDLSYPPVTCSQSWVSDFGDRSGARGLRDVARSFRGQAKCGPRSIVKYIEGEATSGGATSDLSLSAGFRLGDRSKIFV